MISREAIILNYTASAAWKFRDVFGVGATVQWIQVPRLVYSLMIDGMGIRGVANPVQARWTSRPHQRLDPFTFNAILGGVGPAGARLRIRRGGAGGAARHRHQQHAVGGLRRPDARACRSRATARPPTTCA